VITWSKTCNQFGGADSLEELQCFPGVRNRRKVMEWREVKGRVDRGGKWIGRGNGKG